MGREGAGRVAEVGEAVTQFKPGDAVAFCMVPGSYAQYVCVEEKSLIRVPEGTSFEVAASVLLQGMTAHYLCKSTFPVQPGQRVLVHAASGGVGGLLTQMCHSIGAVVAGTVSTEAKAEEARAHGCDHVALYAGENDWAQELLEATGGEKFDVVFDSVGKDTFAKSLELLRPRGMMVLYGQSSGPVEPVNPQVLSVNGSLFMTRPTLGHYTLTREELDWGAGEVIDAVQKGELSIRIGVRIP
eukprot:EC693180.1.p2 GENE.EC693180.1~~EC693180.1.p2  ORF type:complete len:256 (+),score=60.31 EC693180.1:43-768(+)